MIWVESSEDWTNESIWCPSWVMNWYVIWYPVSILWVAGISKSWRNKVASQVMEKATGRVGGDTIGRMRRWARQGSGTFQGICLVKIMPLPGLGSEREMDPWMEESNMEEDKTKGNRTVWPEESDNAEAMQRSSDPSCEARWMSILGIVSCERFSHTKSAFKSEHSGDERYWT